MYKEFISLLLEYYTVSTILESAQHSFTIASSQHINHLAIRYNITANIIIKDIGLIKISSQCSRYLLTVTEQCTSMILN